MGCESSQEVKNTENYGENSTFLVVATLNYGGILNSPLQFFSDSQQEERQISTIFRQLIPQYVSNFDQKTFKWDIGKIDQKIQKQRYTPIYRPKIGVENNKLIGKVQFQRKWDEAYNLSKKKVTPQPSPLHIQNMKLFDLICYHTLLKYIYKINSLEQIQNRNLDVQPYVRLTEKYFNRSYLNEQKKTIKVKQSLSVHQADIFCFQQPTQFFIDSLKSDSHFFVYQKGPAYSMILFKKKSFRNIYEDKNLKSILTEKQYKDLDWNDDTTFVICDKYIIISGHLSSKKQKNLIQVQQMKKSLNNLRQKLPGYEIIVGADTNSFVTSKDIEDFEIFPNLNSLVTTRKKRTFLQPQFNKADVINEQCKDQIFSTLKILKKQIVTIESEEIDVQKQSRTLLPTDKHPFDHFMVVCTLQKKK